MAYDGRNGDGVTAADCYAHQHRRDIKRAGDSSENLDSISSLPDVLIQQILSFLPTKVAIRTSVLSRRWRHVWPNTPSLSFDFEGFRNIRNPADFINETLARYTARKMMRFHLDSYHVRDCPPDHDLNKWIEFALSRNVENLSLQFSVSHSLEYSIPDFFYTNSSVKQLNRNHLITRCSVSWTSLKKLSLHSCYISEESLAKILCGCPILEILRLYCLSQPTFLDLSKSPRLRVLKIKRRLLVTGATLIVAPHIHDLRLTNSQLPCTLVDVSSLTKVKLDIDFCQVKEELDALFLQIMALEMLEKLKNVQKLTFGENFLKILSLVELRGVSLPIFKVQVLTLRTTISQYVIHGIVRVLQNSPQLKKLTLLHSWKCGFIPEDLLDYYLEAHSLNQNRCWILGETWPLESKVVASFMKIMLQNTKTLEKMVVIGLKGYCPKGKAFEELLQMDPMPSHDNNVAIVFT
ncbi:PREDICTED: putative F-box protein At1g49610 [Camelina sativa]|uniref:F-box protein At1g49610 n=1 Tax=Camelina sativa TaxID=90675 RepID=A0ABM0SLE8_CAMSA|nr:PREDICTED: putative F-box protein At1g49610 [Camelina sativa]